MLVAERPEFGLQLGWRDRDKQVPQRLHGGIKGRLITRVRGLSRRRRGFLGRDSARPYDIIRDLLAANSARVALIAMRMGGKEGIRKHACIAANLVDALHHLGTAAVAALAEWRMMGRNHQGLVLLCLRDSRKRRL